MKHEISKKFRFRNFPVYQDARSFIQEVYEVIQIKFPHEEKFKLQSQLDRALISIVLNIAEGSDRGSDKDFAHFLNIAQTSMGEVIACFDIALDRGYFNELEVELLCEKAARIVDQITAFRVKLLSFPAQKSPKLY